MNRFLLQLASMKDVVQAPPDADLKTNRFAAGQKLISDETQRLLTGFLLREKAAAQYRHTERDEVLHGKFTALVMELLSGLIKMDSDHLKDMAWIDSVLLGTCIQSKNEDIRMAVQKLVQRTSPTPNPYPVPVKPQPPAEVVPTPEVDSKVPVGESDVAPSTETVLVVENSVVVQDDASGAPRLEIAVAESPLQHEELPANEAVDVASTSDTVVAPAVQELTSAPSDEGVDAAISEDPLPPRSEESDAPAASDALEQDAPEPDAPEPAPAESWNPMSWFSGGSSSPRTSGTSPADPLPIVHASADEEPGAKAESEAPVAAAEACDELDDAVSTDNENDAELPDAVSSGGADELVLD